MVSVYDRRTCISLDNVALLRVFLKLLPLDDDIRRDTGKSLARAGVETGRVVKLIATLDAPVPHLYFAGRFIEEFDWVQDTLRFLLGFLVVANRPADRVRRADACRSAEDHRERCPFQVRFHASLRFRSCSVRIAAQRLMQRSHPDRRSRGSCS